MFKHNTMSTFTPKMLVIFLFSLSFNCLFSFHWTCTVHCLCSDLTVTLQFCNDFTDSPEDLHLLWLTMTRLGIVIVTEQCHPAVSSQRPAHHAVCSSWYYQTKGCIKLAEDTGNGLKNKMCVLFRMIHFVRNKHQSPIWNTFLMINTAV